MDVVFELLISKELNYHTTTIPLALNKQPLCNQFLVLYNNQEYDNFVIHLFNCPNSLLMKFKVFLYIFSYHIYAVIIILLYYSHKTVWSFNQHSSLTSMLFIFSKLSHPIITFLHCLFITWQFLTNMCSHETVANITVNSSTQSDNNHTW